MIVTVIIKNHVLCEIFVYNIHILKIDIVDYINTIVYIFIINDNIIILYLHARTFVTICRTSLQQYRGRR